ncbi:MAG: universal stress protein [Catenulispora sp.]|nr:universal stress protein [Catenulispora sp.]
MNAPVVVGYDQSEQSDLALREAVRQAESRGSAVRIVHGYVWATPVVGAAPLAPVLWQVEEMEDACRNAAKQLIEQVAAEVRTAHPGLTVETVVKSGSAPAIIAEAAEDAALVVVGSRGRGGFTGLLLGSTSQRVLALARCPVLVVRDRLRGDRGRILVGLDIEDARSCDTLLEFAYEEAARHPGTSLSPVHVWDEPWAVSYAVRIGEQEAVAAEHERADRFQERTEPWRAKYPGVDTHPFLLEGSAAKDLVELSDTADLVVVGASSRPDGRRGRRLGPVAQAVLHHAHCPVAVVPTW